MSRSRWAVLLGPPFLIVLAGAAGAADAERTIRPGAGSMPTPRSLAACPSGQVQADGRVGPGRVRPAAAWWRVTPTVDAAGTLAGWTILAGDRSASTYVLSLPPESSASGPVTGQVLAAVDDGRRSTLRLIDLGAGCVRDLDVGEAVARRAVFDPSTAGFLVHLVARGSRVDLGVWHVDEIGRRTRVLEPVDAATLALSGIRRVWATNLAVAADGRVAVQSCDPDDCLTRLLDRRSGRLGILRGDQGDLVGFAGDRLISTTACGGPPCDITASTVDGRSRLIAAEASGAAVTADGQTVVVTRGGGTSPSAAIVDPATGATREIGALDPDARLLGSTSTAAGVEAGPGQVGLLRPDGPPAILEVKR